MDTLYILIPTHNRNKLLLNLLDSISKLKFDLKLEILILNSGRKRNLINGFKFVNKNLNLRTINIEGHRLWGQAIISGLDIVKNEVSESDKILFLNDDVLVEQKFIDHVKEEWSTRMIIQSPKVVDLNNTVNSGLYKVAFLKITNISEADSLNLANSASGRGLIFDAEALKHNIKYLDHLLPHYLFDIIFSYNLVSIGYDLRSNDNFTLKSQNIFGTTAYENARFLTKYFDRKSSHRLISLIWFWILALVIRFKKKA
jgi:hypothetical protein